ncbi:hypothetical protein Pfo_030161 [Paulownia fortunei]|nr:hypothetical protein Pfo_030161 [Paulownia fortunei]
MAKPQVTITLGRSVVKKSWGDSEGGRAIASVPSGSKRSLSESFGSGADHLLSNKKRVREDVSARSYGYSSHIDGPRDLRLKLTRKRISRRMELENEERKKMELHEKVSRAIRSLESPDHNLLRSIPSSRRAAETPMVGSMRSSYASWTSNGVRTRSPERIPKSSGGISTPGVLLMNCRRTEGVLMSSPMDSSRPKVPMHTTSRRPLDSGKLVTELPPAAGGMSRSPYQDNQPLTVSSLLHSLGLGKYSINFQAEEIDMVALKQMGDSDLKELGIPMGPRKKILQALQARTKHPTIHAQNHVIMKL